VESTAAIIAFNRENLPEDSLQSVIGPLPFGNVHLQKVRVRINLVLNEVGWLDDFRKLSEVLAIRHDGMRCWGILGELEIK
jgi:hypothetical protein